MLKTRILITCLTGWTMIIVFFSTHCIAQTPTKQETIDWIKEKIQKNPGCYHYTDEEGGIDTVKTSISGDYIITTFTSKMRRKNLIATETFSLYNIVCDDGNIYGSEGRIWMFIPKGKIEHYTNIEGYGVPGHVNGQVQLAIYWPGEYDLMNRMVKALKNLSDYNKPHEKY